MKGIAGTGTGTGGAPRWGARRNYQDLMEAQTQANILLEEHLYALPHITERQVRVDFRILLPLITRCFVCKKLTNMCVVCFHRLFLFLFMQKIRHKTLGNAQHLLQQLQAPLSLDQAKNFIQQQKRAAAGGKGNRFSIIVC